jgi:hypothetical protein
MQAAERSTKTLMVLLQEITIILTFFHTRALKSVFGARALMNEMLTRKVAYCIVAQIETWLLRSCSRRTSCSICGGRLFFPVVGGWSASS